MKALRFQSGAFKYSLFVCAVTLGALSPCRADVLTDAEIKYELLKGDTFEALVLMSDSAVSNPLDKSLALKNFGMLGQSRADLQAAMNSNAKEEGVPVRHLAQYYLGLDAWTRGDYAEAEAFLKKARDQGVGDERARLDFYLSDAMLKQDRPADAAKLLGKAKEGLWTSYAYYNLGLLYAGQDSEPARAIISLRVAEAMNPKDSEQALELLDNINFAAGYLSLNAGEPERSLSFLNKIRTEGEAAPRALYIHGVAHADAKNYRAAIQSWYRVKKFPLVNAGVAEAFMALPYAYEKEGYIAKSATSWLEAISVFDKETRTVETIRETVNSLGVGAALFRKSALDDLEWFLSESIATNSPKVSYLNFLMSDAKFAAMAENALQLDELITNLEDWQRDLNVFDRMLEERINGYYRRIKQVNLADQHVKRDAFQAQWKKLQAEFVKAESEKDFLRVSAGDTQALYSKVQSLKKTVESLKPKTAKQPENMKLLVDASDRLERLEGVLVWSAQELFERNARMTRDTLDSVERELGRYDGNLEQLSLLMKQGPDSLVEFKRNFAQYSERVASALKSARKQKSELDKNMSAVALEVLDQKHRALITYREKSEQALAHTYEYISLLQIDMANQEKQKSNGGIAK